MLLRKVLNVYVKGCLWRRHWCRSSKF